MGWSDFCNAERDVFARPTSAAPLAAVAIPSVSASEKEVRRDETFATLYEELKKADPRDVSVKVLTHMIGLVAPNEAIILRHLVEAMNGIGMDVLPASPIAATLRFADSQLGLRKIGEREINKIKEALVRPIGVCNIAVRLTRQEIGGKGKIEVPSIMSRYLHARDLYAELDRRVKTGIPVSPALKARLLPAGQTAEVAEANTVKL